MFFVSPLILISLIQLAFMIIVIFLVHQQKMSYFNIVKNHFTLAYLAFTIGFLCETLMLVIPIGKISYFLVKANLSFTLLCLYIIGLASSILYKKPLTKNLTAKNVFMEFFVRKPSPPFIGYNVLVLTLLVLTWVFSPFRIVEAVNLSLNGVLYVPRYKLWFIIGWLTVLVAFIVYPNYLFLTLTRNVRSKETSKRLKQFSACLMGIGISFFMFHILLGNIYFESVYLGNFINTSLFAFMVYIFRRSTVFFELSYPTTTYTKKVFTSQTYVNRFSRRIGLETSQIIGKKILLFEFNPASPYEKYVKDFIFEAESIKSLSIIFSRKGGKLSTLPNQRTVIFSVGTKTPIRVEEKTLTVSMTDASIILEAFRRILEEYPNSWIVVDNLTDITLTLGFEKTYGLLTHILELLSDRKNTIMFLFNPKAHEVKVREAYRNLVDLILTAKNSELKLLKV